MTKKEPVQRNIGLTFDFLRQVAKNPSLIEQEENGSTLEYIEKDFSKRVKNKTSRTKSKKKYLRIKTTLEPV